MTNNNTEFPNWGQKWLEFLNRPKDNIRSKLIDAVAYHEGWEESAISMVDEALMPIVDRLTSKLDAATRALEFYADKTQTIFEPCPGNHTNYSSMFDLPNCKLCGKNEDTRGGNSAKTVLDADGQVARNALKLINESEK